MANSRYIFVSFIGFVLLTISCKQSDPVEKNISLVWSDEFNDAKLDESKWDIQLGNGSDYGLWAWGNNEKQYYKSENISIENGHLRIKAVREDIEDYNYTSGRIRSINKGDFKYGRVEASIRMDDTEGLWNAFWMLPTNPASSWPVSGEIDIMEYVGKTPNKILNYIHFADINGTHQSKGGETDILFDRQFHQYAVEWDENKIVWSMDSVETFEVLRTNEDVNSTWPFDAKFHILLNLAVGGNLGGPIDVQALESPKYMEIDYVRVYQ